MKVFPVILLVAFGLFSSCKSQCRQLSEHMCECSLNSNEKSTCLGRAASQESANPPTFADEELCKSIIYGAKKCDCHLLDTTQGKIDCGLARNPNAGSDAGN